MARFSCLSIRLALRLLLLFAILLQILARSPVDAKVISYSHASNLDAHKNRGPVINRPSHRLRIERRAPLAVDTVSTLAPESTAVADQTLLSPSHKTSHPYSRSVEQGRPTPSFSVTLGPQESEVSLWPSHVRLGSDQTDFVGWPGSGGLLALGIVSRALEWPRAAGSLLILTPVRLTARHRCSDNGASIAYPHHRVSEFGWCEC